MRPSCLVTVFCQQAKHGVELRHSTRNVTGSRRKVENKSVLMGNRILTLGSYVPSVYIDMCGILKNQPCITNKD